MKKQKMIGGIVTGLVLAGGIILGAMSIENINQGHIGVVWSRTDGVQEQTLGEGWTLVSPLHRVIEFPISTETVDVEEFSILTRDGKSLGLSMSYDYSVKAEYATDVFTKFRGQSSRTIEAGWLEDRAMRAALNVFSQHSVLDVFQNFSQIQTDVYEEFRSLVDEYGFVVRAVTLQAPEMDGATAEAIQRVVDAQQKLEQLDIERQQAEVEAERQVAEARGVAESAKIRAEGEAQANELLLQSITPELIQYFMVEQWNGELPVVSGANSMIQLPGEILGNE